MFYTNVTGIKKIKSK